jgi:hypothetical protein
VVVFFNVVMITAMATPIITMATMYNFFMFSS